MILSWDSEYLLDSSALVKRYVQETGTAWVRRLHASKPIHVIYIARITAVEVTSAVARRRRGKPPLAPAQASSILRRFRQHLAGRYTVIEITPALLNEAARLANAHRFAPTTPCSSPPPSKSTESGAGRRLRPRSP